MDQNPDNDLIDDKLVNYIESNFEKEKLKRIITKFSVVAWDRKMQDCDLNKWLNNFNGNVLKNKNIEQILALIILMNYTYYSEEETRELCKCVFKEYIHIKLLDLDPKKIKNNIVPPELIHDIIDNTIFLPLGNPGDSGTNILYYFRQANKLNSISFEIDENKIPYQNVVFIDDVTLSGNQAWKNIEKMQEYGHNQYLLTLISSEEAHDLLKREYEKLKIISAITLDDRSKCFSDSSFIFSGEKMRPLKYPTKKMCHEYGKTINSNHPLGYSNGQYLFGFHYNTPNNTLPIIWGNKNRWTAAFPRYSKKNQKGAGINESRYV